MIRGMGGCRRDFGVKEGGLPGFDFCSFRLDRGSGDMAMQLATKIERARSRSARGTIPR